MIGREATTAPAIELSQISLSLGGRPVLSDLTMQISAGRWHAVLGRSGVGKSSLLRLLAGLETPHAGNIASSNGLPLSEQLAFMSQDDGLLPWLSVLDNVQMGARLRGEATSASAQRAEDLLAKVSLQEWKNKLPASLSGGMRQRVALARTLFEQRAVVLMDEPFSRLDAVTRDELQTLAFNLLGECTVVLVTHDPLEALRLADCLTILQAGAPTRLRNWQPDQPPLRDLHDQACRDLLPELWHALRDDSAISSAAS